MKIYTKLSTKNALLYRFELFTGVYEAEAEIRKEDLIKALRLLNIEVNKDIGEDELIQEFTYEVNFGTIPKSYTRSDSTGYLSKFIKIVAKPFFEKENIKNFELYSESQNAKEDLLQLIYLGTENLTKSRTLYKEKSSPINIFFSIFKEGQKPKKKREKIKLSNIKSEEELFHNLYNSVKGRVFSGEETYIYDYILDKEKKKRIKHMGIEMTLAQQYSYFFKYLYFNNSSIVKKYFENNNTALINIRTIAFTLFYDYLNVVDFFKPFDGVSIFEDDNYSSSEMLRYTQGWTRDEFGFLISSKFFKRPSFDNISYERDRKYNYSYMFTEANVRGFRWDTIEYEELIVNKMERAIYYLRLREDGGLVNLITEAAKGSIRLIPEKNTAMINNSNKTYQLAIVLERIFSKTALSDVDYDYWNELFSNLSKDDKKSIYQAIHKNGSANYIPNFGTWLMK